MIEHVQPISYRLAEGRDAQAINRLWTGETNWGAAAGAVGNWYGSNPHDGSLAVVAVDGDGQVVGEFIFMAAEVLVDGRAHKALRPIAPIVKRSLRRIRAEHPAGHPFFGMYLYAAEVAREMGISFLYTLPEERWVRRGRLLKLRAAVEHASFPLWSVRLPRPGGDARAEGCEAGPLEWDERVDELWARTLRLHACLVKRDANMLRWRGERPGYEVTAVRAAGELIGIAVSRTSSEQWLICDLLTRDGSGALEATLSAICGLAERRSETGRPFEKVAILVTPFLERAVKSLGFVRDDYDFPLVVHTLSREIAPADIAPQRWYVSAND